MFRKLFPIVVAMVVVLAFGSVHAQTTVKIAILDDVATLSNDDEVVVQGAPSHFGSYTFISECSATFGFDGEYPIRRILIIDQGFAMAVTSNEFTGKLSNFVLVASCIEGADTYRIYTADVSPSMFFTVSFIESISTSSSQIVTTGVAVSPLDTNDTCWAFQGFPSQSPGVRGVELRVGLAADIIVLWTAAPIPPGTRLENIVLLGACSVGPRLFRIFIADVVSPVHGGPLLVEAPADVNLESNSESLAKSDSDSTGISNFVCITPGSEAEHTELWCDVPIERGDRIIGFHSPLVDPDTGVTYWWAELEY